MPASPDKQITKVVHQGIKAGAFPGAQLVVRVRGKLVLDQSYGCCQITPYKISTTVRTLFDISSLTKPIVIVSLILLALRDRKIRLNTRVQSVIPEIAAHIEVGHLLQHRSGLPAWKAYHEFVIKHLEPLPDARQLILEDIIIEARRNRRTSSVIYSDLGFMLLGFLLERLYQESLNRLFETRIIHALHLIRMQFLPARHDQIAATELCTWRHRLLKGEVMDGSAAILGGSAGHAGLFATARDIDQWLCLLRAARYGASTLIPAAIAAPLFTLPSHRDLSCPYFHFGFDTPTLGSSSGQYFSPQSIGHLGYTGCSFWWDLEQDLWVVLLTNRVHPTRKNLLIKTWRPLIHDAIMKTYCKNLT